jgi:hypothetical protein
MAGIRLVDKRLTKTAIGDWEQCTLFVLSSQYVLLMGRRRPDFGCSRPGFEGAVPPDLLL